MSATRIREQLQELAQNLLWSWNPNAIKLFRDLDSAAFRASGHCAKELLAGFDEARLEEIAADAGLRARIDRAYREQRQYLSSSRTWADTHAAPLRVRPVAYFSAEFGLHESLPIYSGGLGVLAGDHLKSASDLGLDLVGVGLFYRESYFRQRIDRDGNQHAEYVHMPVASLPVEPALDRFGKPIVIEVPLTHMALYAQVWRVSVGRNSLYLLDTDVEGNTEENRQLAARLYYGDSRVRMRQEALLGIGGMRALAAVGVHWGVLHLNEGHSAFAVLEATRQVMEETGSTFEVAALDVAEATVFTTHTPVDAGHDRFSPELVLEHLEPLRHALGVSRETLLGLGRLRQDDAHELFCMTVLAFKMSRYRNAVSALHGRVTRRSWQMLWPGVAEQRVPIGHITNGVHVRSWLAPAMQELYERHIGRDWMERLTQPEMWARIDAVPDSELWETHRALKARLVEFVRRQVAAQWQRAQLAPELVEAARSALSPDVLTIGFARRFATYKRASLLFSDMPRLVRLITNPERPVQLVFAGKAHPADQPGQDVLRRVNQAAMAPELFGRVMFVEGHDINVGRHLVQGVDVWLNTPRRPQEASGTSGQKVLLNGGLNLSILDGWWAEAYDGSNGFAIKDGWSHVAPEQQDARDAAALYETLENEVVPLFYDRDEQHIPVGWLQRMRRAIRTLGWRFNTDRMLMDYARECYLPAAGASSCRMPGS